MEQFFTDFLEAISPALQTLIISLVTLLLGQASVYVNKKYQELKGNVSADQAHLLDFIVERAVATVEQLYKDAPNEIKRANAIFIAEKALENYGIKIDLNVIEDAIEAAVFDKKPINVTE